MTDNEFKDILDDCLHRLLIYSQSLEDCLSAYPQYANELKPLLITAVSTKQITDSLEPRPEFKARVRYQLQSELSRMGEGKRKSPFSVWRFRLATILTTVLVMLMASGGLVFAAGKSMPDSPLYPLKLAVEQLQINLTFSDIGKARLYSQFADRRVEEIIQMAQAGKAEEAKATTQRLDDHLSMIGTLSMNYEWKATLASEDMLDATRVTETQGVTVTTVAGGTLELVGPTVIPDVPSPVTPTVIIPDIIVVGSPPYITLDDSFLANYTEGDDIAELINLLFQNGNSNAAELRSLLDVVDDELKPIILEAIALIESSYQNAIDAITD